jgi:thiol:disulfide interchange protein/DsbC/DsbD-like thiol-disulfide interchange protein
VPERATLTPGQGTVVAVKLKHEAGFHSYWLNPGGPGKATTISVKSPEGYSVGAVSWPTPHLVAKDGNSYVYDGEITALAEVVAPAEAKVGEAVELELGASGLVCSDVNCVPFRTAAKVTLTVAAAAGEVTAEGKAAVDEARGHMPVAVQGWEIQALRDAATKQLALALTPKEGAVADLKDVWFFNQEEVIDSQKSQELVKQAGRWLLKLPALEDAEPATELKGVLNAVGGWLDGKAEPKAFAVALPIQEGSFDAAAAANDSAEPAGGSLTLLASLFLGGLLLNVMPCVFPVLGIKIMGFVNQAGGDKRQILLHGLAYTLGVLVCFWVLTLFVLTLGKGWGGQLQEPKFVLAMAFFFLAFGMSMYGVFEFGTSATAAGNVVHGKKGLMGSFLGGLFATIVATPCSAPFLGPALAWALSLPKGTALLAMTCMGLGLSVPYLVFSMAPGLVKLLPRPGAWMETFKQAMSFFLFGSAGYMLFCFFGLVPDEHQLATLLGLTVFALGCWIYGRWCLPHLPTGTRVKGMILALVAAAGGLAWAWPPAPAAEDDIVWKPWSPDLVKALTEEGSVVYVDFTARWCSTCLLNKAVYKDPEIKALFKKHRVETLKADWTDNNEAISLALHEMKRAAIPVNVLHSRKLKEPLIFNDDNLFASEIKEALAKAGLE